VGCPRAAAISHLQFVAVVEHRRPPHMAAGIPGMGKAGRVYTGIYRRYRESPTDKRSDGMTGWVGGPGGRVSKIQSVLKGYL